MRSRRDLPIDVEDAAVLADIERPSRRQADDAEDPIRPSHFLRRIAQDGIIEVQRRGKLRVGLRPIDARGKIPDAKLPQRLAALTERLAFGGSTARKRFREPRDDDRFVSGVVLQPINTAVGAGQREIGRGVARRQNNSRHRETRRVRILPF